MKVSFCPQESWIIEMHLKVQVTYPIDYDNILLLFRSMGYDTEELLDLSKEELWYLRETITPVLGIGNKTGMDVLKKIYRAIVKMNCHRLQVPGREVEMPPVLPDGKEEKCPQKGQEGEGDACRSSSQGPTQDCPCS